jgi:hypothetical protein
MGLFVDDSRDWDWDPFFAWLGAAAGPLSETWTVCPRSPRHFEGVAIMIAGAHVERVREYAVDDSVGP